MGRHMRWRLSEMRRLGVAVVGTGSWGQNHVRVYNELPETELVCTGLKRKAHVYDTIAWFSRLLAEDRVTLSSEPFPLQQYVG